MASRRHLGVLCSGIASRRERSAPRPSSATERAAWRADVKSISVGHPFEELHARPAPLRGVAAASVRVPPLEAHGHAILDGPLISTPRLTLVAATAAILDAELEGPEALSSVLSAVVPEGWPPGEYDRPAIEFFRARIAEQPQMADWYAWYAISRGLAPPTLVASGGYFGPPLPDGIVEIGYSVVPAQERRGYATELVGALVQHAFSDPRVSRVIAHTDETNLASVTVLRRNGFLPSSVSFEPGRLEFILARSET